MPEDVSEGAADGSSPQDGSGEAGDDTAADGEVQGEVLSAQSTAGAPEGTPLPVDGAFRANDGRPVRLLVRPEGVGYWFWIDAQTGEYVGPGAPPEVRPAAGTSFISARAEVPANCEDEGSGLHVRIGPVNVQESGRFVASEAVWNGADCSGEPFAWRAVAIERETGLAKVRFRLGDGSTAVRELEYDPSGLWLLITLANGDIEWQGGSGRVELDVTDHEGRQVAVAEASWGTEPPVVDIPGRAFVPTSFGRDQLTDIGFPPALDPAATEGEVWAVVLEAMPAGSRSEFRDADRRAGRAGYDAETQTCDIGAAAAFGWTSTAESGETGDTADDVAEEPEAAIETYSIYFAEEDHADQARRLFERSGIPAVATQIDRRCPIEPTS